MPTRSLFPTQIYLAKLPAATATSLNTRLLKECLQLRVDDVAGQRWSKHQYPGGFTSYGSAHRMHLYSPTFAELQQKIDGHVRKFARALDFDLDDRPLEMTDCWVSIMPFQTAHSLHLHPVSTISGTYYVKTPRGCPGLKFEDPRLDRYMAAPPRRSPGTSWHTVPAEAGNVLLFESWLRHEVPANPVKSERVSISFNYNWF